MTTDDELNATVSSERNLSSCIIYLTFLGTCSSLLQAESFLITAHFIFLMILACRFRTSDLEGNLLVTVGSMRDLLNAITIWRYHYPHGL